MTLMHTHITVVSLGYGLFCLPSAYSVQQLSFICYNSERYIIIIIIIIIVGPRTVDSTL